MKGLFAGFLVAAVTGGAFLLAPGGLVREASAKPSKARTELAPGTLATDGAQGSMEITRDRRGDRIRLRMENLKPRTRYEVRDAATRETLTGFRSTRSGKGKARLANADVGGIQVCETGADGSVLEGDIPADGDFVPPWNDFSMRTGSVVTDWDAPVQVGIDLTSFGDPASEAGTVESIDLWVSGTGVVGPVTLWIADDEGVLQQVASVDAFDWTDPGPMPMMGDPSAGFGPDGSAAGMNGPGGNGKRHARRAHKMGAMGDASGANCPIWNGDGGNGDGSGGWDGGWVGPDSFFSWYADSTMEGGLPLGLASAADFTGRAFEVRDGEGTVLFSGDLPVLEEITFEPMPMPDPGTWTDFGNGFSFDFNFSIDINIDFGGSGQDMDPELKQLLDDLMAFLGQGSGKR